MPTSVGPNTFGEENLVFAFDTGDTVNSYKGEPTENLVDAFPDTSLPLGLKWDYEYSASISDSPIGNHFLSDRKWVKLVKTSATNGRVLFNNINFTSGSTYTVTAYAYINDNRNTRLIFNSDNTLYSQAIENADYNLTNIGTVQRIRGTWNQLQNDNSIYGLRGGSLDPTGSTIYMTGFQVEENGHPTQLTNGTRSATQGLLDLTGNSTLDLSNVSFDSNAQMTFDGTDDKVTDIGPVHTRLSSSATEVVFKAESLPSEGFAMIFGYKHVGGNFSQFTTGPIGFKSDGTVYSSVITATEVYRPVYSSTITLGEYYHVVVNKDTQAGTLQLYLNGELVSNSTFDTGAYSQWPTTGSYIGTDYLEIGGLVNNSSPVWTRYLDGSVPLGKLYSRTLTASEIKSNFNAIKGRFNI